MGDVRPSNGKRRIDRVLSPGYVEALDDLGTDEVRSRRDLARAELQYLSLLRRLLQGRRDILGAELDRRTRGGDPGPVVDRLAEILSEGPRGPSRGDAPILAIPEEEQALARRRVERLASDASLSDLDNLSDDALREAVGRLEEEERRVSESRGRVIGVVDALQDEVKRRLRADLASGAGE